MSEFLELTEDLKTAVGQLNQVLQGDENTTVMIDGEEKPSVQKKTLDTVNAQVQLVLDAAADIDAVKYTTTAAGIAATTDGQFFSVVSTNDENYIDLYKNDGGTAIFQKSYPSTNAFGNVSSLTDNVYLMTPVGAKVINVDAVNKIIEIPHDTIVFSGKRRWVISGDRAVDFSLISSSAIVLYFNKVNSTFVTRIYSSNLTQQEVEDFLLVGVLRVSTRISFTINGHYSVNGLNYETHETEARIICPRDGTLPNLNSASRTLTIAQDTILLFNEGNYIVPADINILLNDSSTRSKVYFNVRTETFEDYPFGTYPQGDDYNSGVLIATVRKPTTADTIVIPTMDIGCPYTVDGKLFNIVRESAKYLIPIITSRGGLPNFKPSTGILTIPNDTILVSDSEHYIVPATDIDLGLDPSNSTKRVYYNKDNGNFTVKRYDQYISSAEKGKLLLVATARLDPLSNSSLTISCDYEVEGANIRDPIKTNMDFAGIFTPLYGIAPDDLKFPNYDQTNSTLTLYEDTVLSYGNTRYVVPSDTVIDASVTSSSAKKIYWRLSDNTFSVTAWSTNISDADSSDLVFLAMIRSTVYGTAISMMCPYTVDGNLFGLDLSKQVVENGLDEYVKAIAHRGYNIVAPENTIPAYELARKNGFKYFECDVEWTSDGVPVLLHDSTIDRTSNGTGNVKDLTLTELRQYDFGSWKGAEFTGTQIPTLEEFLLFCKKVGAHPYIELKGVITETQAIALKNTIVESGLQSDQYSFISFSSISLSLISVELPQARLGLVGSIGQPIIDLAVTLRNGQNEVFIDVAHAAVTRDSVKLASNAGFELEVWTVNDTPRTLALADMGVSGISTDIVNVKEAIINSL